MFFFLEKKTYVYGDVHVMQDAQHDRSQICLNYVTKGPYVFAKLVVNFIVAFYTMFVRYIYMFFKSKIKLIKLKIPFCFQTLCE